MAAVSEENKAAAAALKAKANEAFKSLDISPSIRLCADLRVLNRKELYGSSDIIW